VPLDAFNCRDADASEIRRPAPTEAAAFAKRKHLLAKVTLTGQSAAGDLLLQGIGQPEQCGDMAAAALNSNDCVAADARGGGKFGLIEPGVASGMADCPAQTQMPAFVGRHNGFLPANRGGAGQR
jgi:hypothetical protein